MIRDYWPENTLEGGGDLEFCSSPEISEMPLD